MRNTQKPSKISETNIRSSTGSPVIAATFKGNFKVKDIKEIAKDYQQQLRDEGKNGRIAVNVLLPNRTGEGAGWRMLTPFVDIDDDILFKEDEEYEDYYGRHETLELPDKLYIFQVLFSEQGKPEGGCSGQRNDCLYECLVQMIPDIMKKSFPTPEELKNWCGLKRCDKVPIKKIPKIEEKLGDYKINVLGEVEYISTKKAKHTLTLFLEDEHYYIYSKFRNYVKGMADREKPILIYKDTDDPSKVRIYSHERGYRYMDIDKFKRLKHNYLSCRYRFIKCHKGKTMRETYKEFIEEATRLKVITDGKYNLFKACYYKVAALNRFYELNKYLIPDEIDVLEEKWISKASSCSLMWCKKDYKGEGYSYDINSQYPRIVSDGHFLIPIKKGEFKTITQKELKKMKYFEFGIYRCEVTGYDYRLFKRNNNNYYTHYCLNRAKELGYKIKMIEDGEPNLLSYAGAGVKINGSTAFGQYVNELYQYKIKYPGYNVFKNLLNILWGSLCEKVRNIRISTDKNPFDAKKVKEKIIHAVPLGNDKYPKDYKITTMPYDNIYRTPFARLAPFLLSRGRTLISNIIEPHLDSIVRVHTDGFISTKPLKFEQKDKRKIDNVKIGKELGDLKYEGYEKWIHIKNMRIPLRKDGTKAFEK